MASRLVRGFPTVLNRLEFLRGRASLRTLHLSVFSGLLLVAIFPRLNLAFLAWAALAPLLFAVMRSKSWLQALLAGLTAGAVYFGGVVYWVPRVLWMYGGLSHLVSIMIFLLMIGCLALFVAAFAAAQYFLLERFGGSSLWLAPALWTTAEFARNHLAAGGFPWCLLGYSQAQNLPLIQIADMTGVYGLSFLIALANCVVVSLLARLKPALGSDAFERGNPWLPLSLSFAVALALALGYGAMRLREDPMPGQANSIKVACLQADIPFAPANELKMKFFADYPRLARQAARLGCRLAVMPESPTPFFFQFDEDYRNGMIALARETNMGIVFNNTGVSADGSEPSYFNSAFFLGPDGELISRYDKIHLVPFGEYVPFKRLLFFAGALVREVSSFQPGSGFVVSEHAGVRLATFICFEAIFPELVRQFPRRGAELLLNITNDAWYGDTAAPYQHLSMAILRAVENRRYLVRAANSGISAIVDPYGRVLASSPLFVQTIVTGQVGARKDLTVYARLGDLFAWSCVIIVIGAMSLAFSQKMRRGQ